MSSLKKRAKRIEVLLEFLIFGIVIGITEDILAVKMTTGEPITLKIIGIVILIAIPFAIIGELFADNVDFTSSIERVLSWFERRKIRKRMKGTTRGRKFQ